MLCQLSSTCVVVLTVTGCFIVYYNTLGIGEDKKVGCHVVSKNWCFFSFVVTRFSFLVRGFFDTC